MENINENIAEGTTITITGNDGSHFFTIGTTVTLESAHENKGERYYYARGMTKFGINATQLIRATDFVVVSDGQASSEVSATTATTKTKGDDTLTKKSFTVGQVVRITGATQDPFISMLVGEEINTHSLPIGAVTKVVELADDGDDFVRVSVEGITPTHSHARPGPQWVRFEHVEDATPTDLSKDGEDEVEVVAGEIKPGDEVTVIGNEPCMYSKMLQGMDRGVHGVEIGRTLTVLEVDEHTVIVDTRFEVLADEFYSQDRQAIPIEYVMLASAKRSEKLA